MTENISPPGVDLSSSRVNALPPTPKVDIPHPPYISDGRYRELRSEASRLGYPDELWQMTAEFVVPYFIGREGFEHHTWAVAHWACQLAQEEKTRGNPTNSKVLITAALCHDIGYAGKNDTGSSAKEAHMSIGVDMATGFLQKVQKRELLTAEEVAHILYIISVHDNPNAGDPGKSSETYLLVAADTLGMMDLSFGRPSFARKKLKGWWKTSMGGKRRMGPDGKWITTKTGRWDVMPNDYARQCYLELSTKLLDYIG